MSDKSPRLTGGILFGLILEAKKLNSKVRNMGSGDNSDGLSETDIMSFIVEIFTSEQLISYKQSLKRMVSQYKKCEITSSTYLPFGDQDYINKFNESVNQNKKDILEKMSLFIDEKLSETKIELLISRILEVIYNDESVDDSELFKITCDKQIPKSEFGEITSIEIEPFLLDVMKYIYTNKIDNILGQETFLKWYKQSGYNSPWKLANTKLGSSFSSVKVERYNSAIEDEDKTKIINDESEDALLESDVISETKLDEEVRNQILNNSKIVNQYAGKIYNIEHVENLN